MHAYFTLIRLLFSWSMLQNLSKSSVWKQPRLIRVSCALSPLFHLPFLSLYPPNPSTSARRRSHSPSLHNVFASRCRAFNLTPHSPQYPLLHRSVFAVAGVRLRRGGGEDGREKRAVWNPLASWGISVSLWEPYWLPSFIIIPPPLPPSGSCTNHAFSFFSLSPALYPLSASFPLLFFMAIFIPLFVFACLFFQFRTVPVCQNSSPTMRHTIGVFIDGM